MKRILLTLIVLLGIVLISTSIASPRTENNSFAEFDKAKQSKHLQLSNLTPSITPEYSSFLGGSNTELYPRLALDETGSLFMTGYTQSNDFPVLHPYQSTRTALPCAILSKINENGSTLDFSTYFGGDSAEFFNAIALSGNGDVYIAGDTFSSNLPAINSPSGDKDVFIARFDTAGHYISGRYIGGWHEDRVLDITFCPPNSIIITGFTYSQDFPLKNPFQSDFNFGDCAAYVTKLKADLSEIEYSTFFCGHGETLASRVALDRSGYINVLGRTNCLDFPTNHAFQGYFKGGEWDLFAIKFMPGESELEISTYLGGSGTEYAADLAIGSDGALYIMGITNSTDFPLKNPYQSTLHGGWDFTVTRMRAVPLLDYSTYLGGSADESQGALTLNEQENILVAGTTASADFPVANAFQPTHAGITDAIVSIFSPDGKELLLSSFWGGSSFDYGRDIACSGIDNFYIAGTTDSTDFPLKNPFQDTNHGLDDIYYTKFSYSISPVLHTLTIQSDPDPGALIQVTPTDANNNGSGTTPFTRFYTHSTIATLTAPQAYNGRIFNRWEKDGIPFSNRTFPVLMNADHTVKAIYTTPASIVLNRTRLNFGATTAGIKTGDQTFTISKTGDMPLNWTISDNMSWLTCTPDTGINSKEITVSVYPSGLLVGTYTGYISIIDPNASNSPQVIQVSLNVQSVLNPSVPFGFFETPEEGANVCSSIPVTGWALDDVEVTNVKLYRESGSSLIYIGDGGFVEGARPDVELAYPAYPNNYKAGWGYMLLTNTLPNGGNGTFVLHAVATDKEGNQVTLGTKTIYIDNQHAVKPFGAIDTPLQGGTASGSSFINFGWVLTPLPNMIPIDGSTVFVWIDGVNKGHSVYNIYREDIAIIFPGYLNSNGASGYFYIDTTGYADGLHTIQWTATDNAGNTDGIGSRYFTIRNNAESSSSKTTPLSLSSSQYTDFSSSYSGTEAVEVSTGYNPGEQAILILPDNKGIIHVQIEELGRVEINLQGQYSLNSVLKTQNSKLDSAESRYEGYLIVGKQLRKLPTGSTLDSGSGNFYWQPGPGFVGKYRFLFVRINENREIEKRIVEVMIRPRYHSNNFFLNK